MTNQTNDLRTTNADAVSIVRKAGNHGHRSQSDYAWAVLVVFEHAAQGNLNPGIEMARTWEETARKRANTVLAAFTNGDLKIAKPSDNYKGASLKKGWGDRLVDGWFSYDKAESLILATCPKRKGGEADRNRASLRQLAADLKGGKKTTVLTVEALAKRTVKAMADHMGFTMNGELAEAKIAKAISELMSAEKALRAAAKAQAKAATESAQAKRAASTKSKKSKRKA